MNSDNNVTSVVAAANPTCSIDPKSPNPNARRETGRHKVISQEVSGSRQPKALAQPPSFLLPSCRQIWSKEGVHRTISDFGIKTLLWLKDCYRAKRKKMRIFTSL
jgi:hypothetical protein